jgi:molybdopterin synthase catalytic subunit
MIRVQQEDFDPGVELEGLRGNLQGSAGAVVSFIGLVRDLNAGDAITGMRLEKMEFIGAEGGIQQ